MSGVIPPLSHTYFREAQEKTYLLTLQRGVTGTARILHALTHSSITRQVREQM